MSDLSIPRDCWAIEVIQRTFPTCAEKGTLLAIAHFANPTGGGSIVSHRVLADRLGYSTRTIVRHVGKLVADGEVVSWCDLARRGKSNTYLITRVRDNYLNMQGRYPDVFQAISVRYRSLKLEEYDVQYHTGFGPDQLSFRELVCHTPSDTMSLPQCHGVTQTFLKQEFIKESVNLKKSGTRSGSMKPTLREIRQAHIDEDQHAVRQGREKISFNENADSRQISQSILEELAGKLGMQSAIEQGRRPRLLLGQLPPLVEPYDIVDPDELEP